MPRWGNWHILINSKVIKNWLSVLIRYLCAKFCRSYYIPWNVTTQLMIYNKELFREAGLDPNNRLKLGMSFVAANKINQLPPRADGSPVYGTVLWNDVLSTGAGIGDACSVVLQLQRW
ncbi:extracellular solute-binding protein [Vibrio taketomensis]|uniref:extracellular solute-binding protein n=1 Tax=Vibrio taketomensis TaxID=2572923 RepID=UPI001E2F5293|nr:extracellular solute-binding protein [Vibrio taketomensis]